MRTGLRRLALFGPPLLVVAFELRHPIAHARQMPPAQRIAAESLLDAYWADGNSPNGVIYRLAPVSSIAWVAAMLAAAVALNDPGRRNAAGVAAIVLFAVGGWARTNIFLAPDGMTIRPEWWLVTLGMAVVMFLIARPRIPAALLSPAPCSGRTTLRRPGPSARSVSWRPRRTGSSPGNPRRSRACA
jgi:hypothetical protein